MYETARRIVTARADHRKLESFLFMVLFVALDPSHLDELLLDGGVVGAEHAHRVDHYHICMYLSIHRTSYILYYPCPLYTAQNRPVLAADPARGYFPRGGPEGTSRAAQGSQRAIGMFLMAGSGAYPSMPSLISLIRESSSSMARR